MTIDEFMDKVAPYMRNGWIAMDECGEWCWYKDEPEILRPVVDSIWFGNNTLEMANLTCFDIDPVPDWTKSLRKVE